MEVYTFVEENLRSNLDGVKKINNMCKLHFSDITKFNYSCMDATKQQRSVGKITKYMLEVFTGSQLQVCNEHLNT